MCEYCKGLNGVDHPKRILDEEYDIGIHGKGYALVDVFKHGDVPTLCISIEEDCQYFAKINYCPMCGEKL